MVNEIHPIINSEKAIEVIIKSINVIGTTRFFPFFSIPGEKKIRVQDEIYNYLKKDSETPLKPKSSQTKALSKI